MEYGLSRRWFLQKVSCIKKHPDWVIKAPERDLVLGRGGTQVVLDLGNPQVQDFVFNVVDELMTNYPEIDYIKWDANMSIYLESWFQLSGQG